MFLHETGDLKLCIYTVQELPVEPKPPHEECGRPIESAGPFSYDELASPHVRPGYEPAPVPPSHPGPDIEQHGMYDQHLDAMGSKNGKGKAKGDGKCHTCGGDRHFSRECPSTAPVGPQAVECLGCNGRGHVSAQCPTANPHLKVKGKGTGGENWDSGKGWCGKNRRQRMGKQ